LPRVLPLGLAAQLITMSMPLGFVRARSIESERVALASCYLRRCCIRVLNSTKLWVDATFMFLCYHSFSLNLFTFFMSMRTKQQRMGPVLERVNECSLLICSTLVSWRSIQCVLTGARQMGHSFLLNLISRSKFAQCGLTHHDCSVRCNPDKTCANRSAQCTDFNRL